MTAQTDAASPSDHVLALKRVFQASQQTLFRAFTDPAQVEKWYGPRGFSATVDRFDARPGGGYRLCMTAPDGAAHWLRGAFVAVEPYERLAFTWIWEQGEMAEHEMLVTLSFRPVGDATEVRLEHSRLPSEAAGKAHEGGWISSFECLDELLNTPGR